MIGMSLRKIKIKIDFFWPDIFLILLFAIIGLGGFSRFPNYIAVSDELIDNNISYVWIFIIFLFCVLFIFRKIRSCYLLIWQAFCDSLFLHSIISLIIIAITFAMIDNAVAFGTQTLVAQQAGLAAVYLIVQGWLDISPDLRPFKNAVSDLKSNLSVALRQDRLKSDELSSALSACQSAIAKVDAIVCEQPMSESMRCDLSEARSELGKISELLTSPISEIKGRLPKLIRESEIIHGA